ncbi:MAG: pyridoxamine 5'-phosphate oxidase family protein [Deferribacteraceae bacterium]|jgi:general stress protein 26|nr:pyridoxamine 5'-phosphate oxidase family protein [Deferribacteraceae bacterium]
MNEVIKAAGEIIASLSAQEAEEGIETYCTLALVDAEGYPFASTINVSRSEGIEWVYLCTGLSSEKVRLIQENPRAALCFSHPNYNLSLIGDIEVITEPDIKEFMWYDGLKFIFTGGPSDPRYCVLQFTTKRYKLMIDYEEAIGGMG